jgi:ATP-dependent RNA helicase DDX3X
MAKVDAKGRAEADFYFKLRAEESGKKARGPSKETIRRDREELFDASHGSSGIRFDEYEAVPVQRSGPGAEPRGPKALASFDELADAKFAVPKFVLENVRRCGYKRPTPIQAHCLPLALDDENDLMSCAQTGSGKTCAFLVPAISRLDPNAREGSSDKTKRQPRGFALGGGHGADARAGDPDPPRGAKAGV